jgi:predicted kinase
MVDEKLFDEIYKINVKQLKNISIPHNKIVICFSGIAGSGKTYVAKILEEKYKGVRISSDNVREIILNLEFENLDEITYSYLDWFFENYKFDNKLIILDKGIDRRWKETFFLFDKLGYKIFTIRLEVPEKIYEKRIIEKLGKLDDNYIARINDWKKQFKEFGEKVKSDIIIENEKDNELNLEELYSKLDFLIK